MDFIAIHAKTRLCGLTLNVCLQPVRQLELAQIILSKGEE